MKYILRYELKSKYFGFKKVYYKEFEELEDVYNFIKNNHITKGSVYSKRNNEVLQKLLGEEYDIC